ncbi:MAG: rhomboid family intramembrane serine protease [Chitinophagales bacterium]|nr:rhomboid family intramembrane serine protease [Chitinophagales bacterium]MDW8393631.1 rhomboid family intramembrane serine protease [Chitinophagales bacterium]
MQWSQRARISLFIPLYFIVLLWVIEILDWATEGALEHLGIMPRQLSGLAGIFLAPLLHDDFSHLFSNTVPLFLLGWALIYFYRSLAYRVVLITWLLDGLGVWLIGRPSYHLGASGLVYGMTAFVFFSGLLRRNRQLMALSLAVVFVYGGMVWGMFPYLTHVSWEGHLFGFLTGVFLAVFYRNQGPSDDPVPEWMQEQDGHDDQAASEPQPETGRTDKPI